jgi:hypothetical protein
MFSIYALVKGIKSLFKMPTYGEVLERQILNKYPKDTSDIERFTIEWQRGQSRERII